MLTAKSISLAAVCIQSTFTATILHIALSSPTPFQASSAVLLTELLKFVLSLLLALLEIIRERAALRKLNVHNLPSPELYGLAAEVQAVGLYADDPLDDPPRSPLPVPSSPSFPRHLRRRSTFRGFSSEENGMVAQMDVLIDDKTLLARERQAVLSQYEWPKSPRLVEAFEKAGVDMAEKPQEGIMNMLPIGVMRTMLSDLSSHGPWKMAVPAVLFAVQNNLIYVAARNLSVPFFQVTFQLKTIITAVAAVIMLNRRFALHQWSALSLLAVGVATMQLGSIEGSIMSHGLLAEPPKMNQFLGVTCVLICCLSSAIAATYFELVIKETPSSEAESSYTFVGARERKPPSLWIRNLQLSMFSIIVGVLVVSSHSTSHQSSGAPHGFLYGFDWLTWVVIGLQAVGGLIIALAIKYADTVTKGFALSVSILLSFLLSVVLFDFPISTPSVAGGLLVVGATILFEVDSSSLGQLLQRPYSLSDYRKPALKRWHFAIPLLITSLITIFPSPRSSITSTARDIVHQFDTSYHPPPTIALADMGAINDRLAASATNDCRWGITPRRATTTSPYGAHPPQDRDFPYHVADTDQYALDDILTTRMLDNPLTVDITDQPDFIFLPLLSQIYSNAWNCESPNLKAAIADTTAFIREMVVSVGVTSFPRIVLPVATIRSNLESELFTPELMEEMRDSVIVVSIENAPKSHREGLKYLIDAPYPTRFHLMEEWTSSPSMNDVGDYFLNHKRPFLLTYAAASSHPWGLSPSKKFNGFALRTKLAEELGKFNDLVLKSPWLVSSRIMFDNILDAVDGRQNLTAFQEHMTSSVFCPQPSGDSPTRRGFYDAVLLGCIPVIFRESSYGRLFPSSPEFNTSLFTIFVDENDIISGTTSLIRRLESVPPAEIKAKQRHLQLIAQHSQWSLPAKSLWFPPSSTSHRVKPLGNVPRWDAESARRAKEGPYSNDAFGMLLKELSVIKSGKWIARPANDLARRKE